MKAYFVICFLCLLSTSQLEQLSYLNEANTDVAGLNPFLTLLQKEDTSRLLVKQSNKIRRNSVNQVDVTDEPNADKNSCKCKDRAAKRLRREIKDVSFQRCTAWNGEETLLLSNISLSPSPLIAPGNLHINFDAEVKKQLPESIQIDVDVYKYMFDTLPVSVPCLTVRNVKDLSLGSCTYWDVCSSVKGSACPTFQSNSLPCACEEITPGFYTFSKPLTYIIPNISSIFDVLVKVSSQLSQ